MSNQDFVRRQALIDQAIAEVSNLWPPILREFFLKLIAQGFSQEHSLQLTCTFLMAMISKSGPPK